MKEQTKDLPPAPEQPEEYRGERLRIRRRVALKGLLGRALIRTGRYEIREETAFLQRRTPKGAHFMLGNGGLLHRKNRDILEAGNGKSI